MSRAKHTKKPINLERLGFGREGRTVFSNADSRDGSSETTLSVNAMCTCPRTITASFHTKHCVRIQSLATSNGTTKDIDNKRRLLERRSLGMLNPVEVTTMSVQTNLGLTREMRVLPDHVQREAEIERHRLLNSS